MKMAEEEIGKCAVAIKEALREAIRTAIEEVKNTICKPEDFDKALLEVLGEMLGVEVNPTKCELVLKEPVTERVCKDFYEQRRWVMCKAHQLLKKWREEGRIADIGEAIEEAWSELKEKCLEAGYAI